MKTVVITGVTGQDGSYLAMLLDFSYFEKKPNEKVIKN